MSVSEQEWNEEKQRLTQVREAIRQKLGEAREVVEHHKADIVSSRRYMWDEITYDPDDWFEAAVDLTQQSMELTRQTKGYQLAQKSAVNLKKLLEAPYFGRMDFAEKDAGPPEPIYIGISSFADDETHEILVYDWRAPISGMYYDYPPGPARYQTPEAGSIEGEMTLKRQYVIRRGEMEAMFDTGMAIGDEMLQQMLGKSADEKMKSIVTTIQSEQNQIIRDTVHPYLIVQGAAGSGKTSAALQRVAYLLYKYRNVWSEDQMILFSPNALFNDYVSNVLPELGENNMRQTTYQDYLDYRLGEAYVIEDAYEQMEFLLTKYEDTQYDMRVNSIRLKAELPFFKAVERYVLGLERERMLFRDIALRDRVLFSQEQLSALFYETYRHLPIHSRIERMRESLLEQLETLKKQKMQTVYRKLVREEKYMGTDKEMRSLSEQMVRKRFAPLFKEVKRLEFIDVSALYRQLFEDSELFAKALDMTGIGLPPDIESVRAYTVSVLRDSTEIPYEDASPLLYLKEKIEGMQALNRIKHVIVDEAQDYSAFQYAYLKRIFPRSQMTLLGDVNQAIQAYLTEPGGEEIEELFGKDGTRTIRLAKSYRSTKEIVEFTKAILPDGDGIEPFERSGDKPAVIDLCAVAEEEALERYIYEVRRMQENGAQSIAIICKTAAESELVYRLFQGKLELHLITKQSKTFVTGTVVIPSYMAKGLEFDAVIIHDASRRVYERETERKLFYTVCTRALHQLVLFYTVELTPFVSGLNDSLYVKSD